jgi:FtsZ-binding cell division protein ZapB
MPLQERDQLLERALDQAAAAEAWGLAIELLNQQRALLVAEGADASRPRERLERLSQRVDDAYSAWQLARQDPQQSERSTQLQQQLRSPRAAGGHAAARIATPSPASPRPPQP